MLTKRQKQVLDFINQNISKKGVAPTLREIARHLGIRSVGTAHEHLQALQDKGYLNRKRGQARAVSVQNAQSDLVSIPVLGAIAAGEPIEAIEDRERILIPRQQASLFQEMFALKVRGDSMIDEGINDGDTVIAKKQSTAQNGDRVIALLNNNEVTLKKFNKNSREIRLQPANKKYDPIIVGPDTSISIQGVVVQIVKPAPQQIVSRPEKEKASKRGARLNKVICGDVLEELYRLPSNFFDAIIIDPPYNIGKDFGNNVDRRELADYVTWADQWISESFRTLKSSGTIFIYGFSEILAHLSVRLPLNRQRWLIWHYTNKNVASLNFWQRSHESILCVWKDERIFNRDAVREPYTEGFLQGAAGRVRKDTVGRFSKGGKSTIYVAHEKGALPRDVLKAPALAGGAGMMERWFLCKTCDAVYAPREIANHRDHNVVKHPTQKPLELTRRLLKSCLPKKGGRVLAPFAGTGSECVVARELGAEYLGIEINPEYVQLADGFLAKY
ncbi:MAG: transcriptional repressor LexA [bacterium]|nr:transcriptional repressor LexA [bacterium]